MNMQILQAALFEKWGTKTNKQRNQTKRGKQRKQTKGKVMRYLAANYLCNRIHEHVCLQVLRGLWFLNLHKVSMPNNKEEGKNVVHDLLLVMAFILDLVAPKGAVFVVCSTG